MCSGGTKLNRGYYAKCIRTYLPVSIFNYRLPSTFKHQFTSVFKTACVCSANSYWPKQASAFNYFSNSLRTKRYNHDVIKYGRNKKEIRLDGKKSGGKK